MKRLFTALALAGLATIFLSSCIVSKKKYLAATDRATKDEAEIAKLNDRIARMNETINSLNKEIANLKGRVSSLDEENKNTSDKLKNTTSQLNSTSSQLNMTKDQIEQQRKRLEELQSFIDKQRQATNALRKKIADALVGFSSNELTVTQKNGRVYISMQESLLFPSGSAEVNPKGKEALAKVASVLNTNTDINIDIEGHTDSLPIHNKTYADNWSLSTARATSIAHVLIDEYSVSPAKLIASGRSQYDPVATNSTPEGRGQNRRTEIILEPKLDELMELMNTNEMGK